MTVPAATQRRPPGCPDPSWCRGNGICWWDCTGEQLRAEAFRACVRAELREEAAKDAEAKP